MKSIFKYTFAFSLLIGSVSCENLDTLNEDPNNPEVVPSNMVMSAAEKLIVDNVYDQWFSLRQCLSYAQQIGQRNYTDEDRYQIRETTNNSYFKYLYLGLSNLQNVIDLNTNPETATLNSLYGNNQNQIAAARIMKVWLFDLMTDTWGAIPYSEALKLTSGGDEVYAKYDDQKSIYADMIKELTEAAAQINEDEAAFTGGDVIFGGDAAKWKKFANSLKCRLAIHLSKVDSNWKNYIAEALESGVMTSNEDVAEYKYSTTGTEYCCLFYEPFFIDRRNDFSILKPFTDILSGKADVLNKKKHPWENVVDPRLKMFTVPRKDGSYDGLMYAPPSAIQVSSSGCAPSIKTQKLFYMAQDFAVPLMTYAELQFILCEYNNYDSEYYKAGVKASLDYWSSRSGVSVEDETAYIDAVSANVDAEACALQKYIDLFTNGTEAWTEIRRTGYPEQLIRPGEIVGVVNDKNIEFSPLEEVKGDIVARVKYPVDESTLNGDAFYEAIKQLEDGTNNSYSKMYWDVRKSTYDHPDNL